MNKSTFAIAGCVLAGLVGLDASAGTLIGSFHTPTSPDPQNIQNINLVTRTSNGNADTQGAVEGTVTGVSDVSIGTSSYTGIDVSSFAVGTNFQDLNRFGFGGTDIPGVIVYDFDLATYLSNNPQLTQFSVDATYESRRTGSGAQQGRFFISVNGNGLTLDTTDFATAAPGSGTSIATEATINTTNYALVSTIPADTGSGSFSVDVSAFINGSTDGLVRIAYVDDSFDAGINFRTASGIVGDVPEPGSLALLGLGGLLVARRRR